MIVGIDEVGRGPWAGPLVVGAVVLGCEVEGLTDSKKLSKKRREGLNDEILAKANAVGLGWVSAAEIDSIGLAAALQLACRRSLEQIDTLGVAYHEIIIDGTVNFLSDTSKGQYVTTMKKADLLIPCVSAASIVAKVARDNYMTEQDALYPGYGFASNMGYGTSTHQAAIKKLGVTPLHRLSFAPLAKYKSEVLNTTKPRVTTTREIGNASENVAAEELVRRGHAIIERNWKTKYCEIDIISKKNGVVYFTEVKHRKNARSGDGMAAITTKKLNQMKFAAKLYAEYQKLQDIDLRLIAIATTGDPPEVVWVVFVD